jgi:hypothetical protein
MAPPTSRIALSAPIRLQTICANKTTSELEKQSDGWVTSPEIVSHDSKL